MNDVLRVFSEVQRRQLCPREPADFGGVGGGLQLASSRAAEKINQHVVILHALFGIAEDTVVDAQQFSGVDDQASFFASLADGGVANHFADFENSAGDRPLSLNRRGGGVFPHG